MEMIKISEEEYEQIKEAAKKNKNKASRKKTASTDHAA